MKIAKTKQELFMKNVANISNNLGRKSPSLKTDQRKRDHISSSGMIWPNTKSVIS